MDDRIRELKLEEAHDVVTKRYTILFKFAMLCIVDCVAVMVGILLLMIVGISEPNEEMTFHLFLQAQILVVVISVVVYSVKYLIEYPVRKLNR